jgi:hypothetical protein
LSKHFLKERKRNTERSNDEFDEEVGEWGGNVL